MADLVESVLAAAAEREAAFKTTDVSKSTDPEIDEGNLLIVDNDPIDLREYKYDLWFHLQLLCCQLESSLL